MPYLRAITHHHLACVISTTNHAVATGLGMGTTMSDEFCRYCGSGIGEFRREGESPGCHRCNPDIRPPKPDTRPGATFKPPVPFAKTWKPTVFQVSRYIRQVPIGNGRTIPVTITVPVIAWPGVMRILNAPRGRPNWHSEWEDHCQPKCNRLSNMTAPGIPIVGHRD